MLSPFPLVQTPFPLVQTPFTPGRWQLAATQARVTGLLAHQGGWDEILLVLGPIAVIAGLIVIARRRIGAGHNDGNKRS